MQDGILHQCHQWYPPMPSSWDLDILQPLGTKQCCIDPDLPDTSWDQKNNLQISGVRKENICQIREA